MNRLIILSIVCGAIVAATLVSQSATAQTSLSEAQISRIRQNCVTIQQTLLQLQQNNDVGLRNNQGKLYDDIYDKLMTPLNRRIIEQGSIDGLGLGAIALRYNNQIETFRAAYREYYDSMSHTRGINCASDPADFYESLTKTRDLRQKLHQENSALINLLKEYKTEFEDFAATIEGDE